MTFKKAIGKVHLWLGLASGLVVLFLGITGCILAFQREIENTFQRYRYVEVQQQPMLAPSALQKVAERELPGKHAHSVTYMGPGKAAMVGFYSAEPAYYDLVYLNPYSGKVLKVKDMNRDFFRVVIMGHFYLWLPPAIGQPIVASATLIFVVMMITGIILWWPKNKSARKQRFSVKWDAKWRRKNYDLHNVFGFYMTWIAIFIALTGLVWGFQWFAGSVYWVTSGGKKMVEWSETHSKAIPAQPVTGGEPAPDKLWRAMLPDLNPEGSMDVHFPENDSSSIEVAMNPDISTYWKADYRYFDQYTLEEIPVKHAYGRFANTSTAEKIQRMNYDLHVGAVLGLPGKILAFLASLVAGSLPVTGFLIWWGRKNKKPAKAAPKKVKPALVLQP